MGRVKPVGFKVRLLGCVRFADLCLLVMAGPSAMGMDLPEPAAEGICLAPVKGHETLSGETQNSVAYHNGRFIAVGTNGLVLTSMDGAIWTALDPGLTREIGDVVWAGDRWAFITTDGFLLTWTEMGGWTSRDIQSFNSTYRSLEWDGSKLFITFRDTLADVGRIRTTSDFVTLRSDTVSSALTCGDVTDIDYRNGTIIMSVTCFDFFGANTVYSTDGFNFFRLFLGPFFGLQFRGHQRNPRAGQLCFLVSP